MFKEARKGKSFHLLKYCFRCVTWTDSVYVIFGVLLPWTLSTNLWHPHPPLIFFLEVELLFVWNLISMSRGAAFWKFQLQTTTDADAKNYKTWVPIMRVLLDEIFQHEPLVLLPARSGNKTLSEGPPVFPPRHSPHPHPRFLTLLDLN